MLIARDLVWGGVIDLDAEDVSFSDEVDRSLNYSRKKGRLICKRYLEGLLIKKWEKARQSEIKC